MKSIMNLESSYWINACVYLLDHNATSIFGEASSVEKINAQALYAYNYYQLINFISQASREPMDIDVILDDLISRKILVNEHFISLIVQLLLLPNQYVDAAKAEHGDASHSLTAETIRHALKAFLQLMMDHGPPKFLRTFSQSCATMLHSKRIDLTNMQLNQSKSSVIYIRN